MEQALAWLRNKMAEKNTLDAVNAELTYNVIMDIQKKRRVIGALYQQANSRNKRMQDKMDLYERWPGLDPARIHTPDIFERSGEDN